MPGSRRLGSGLYFKVSISFWNRHLDCSGLIESPPAVPQPSSFIIDLLGDRKVVRAWVGEPAVGEENADVAGSVVMALASTGIVLGLQQSARCQHIG